MQEGDKLKIVEHVKDKKRRTKTTIGIIEVINQKTITIMRLHNGEKTYRVTYNIADCKDSSKDFYLEKESKWIPVKINISEHGTHDKRYGSKYN